MILPVLQDGSYAVVERIRIFPGLEIQAFPQVIEAHRQAGHRAVRKAVRIWGRGQVD